MAFAIPGAISQVETSAVGSEIREVEIRAHGKIASKQLVVCVNEGYPGSLERRKIYVALRDAETEKHGL